MAGSKPSQNVLFGLFQGELLQVYSCICTTVTQEHLRNIPELKPDLNQAWEDELESIKWHMDDGEKVA